MYHWQHKGQYPCVSNCMFMVCKMKENIFIWSWVFITASFLIHCVYSFRSTNSLLQFGFRLDFTSTFSKSIHKCGCLFDIPHIGIILWWHVVPNFRNIKIWRSLVVTFITLHCKDLCCANFRIMSVRICSIKFKLIPHSTMMFIFSLFPISMCYDYLRLAVQTILQIITCIA